MNTKITSATKKTSPASLCSSYPFQFKLSSCCCPVCYS